MPTITININGTPDAQDKLRRIGRGLMDMSAAMRSIGNDFLGYYSSQPFTSQGGIYGVQWPALKPATIKEKVKYNPTTATYPLIRSGQMMRSFEARSGSTFMELSNTQKYFKYHQLGTRHMPQRIIMTLTRSRYNAIKSIIEADIRRKIELA